MREWTDTHILELINETAIKKKIDPYEQAFDEFLRNQSGLYVNGRLGLPATYVSSNHKQHGFVFKWIEFTIDEPISVGQTGTVKGTIHMQIVGMQSMPEGAYLGTVLIGWEPNSIGLSLVQFEVPKSTEITDRVKKIVDYPSIIIDHEILSNAGLNPVPSETNVRLKGMGPDNRVYNRVVKYKGYDIFVTKKMHDETIIPGETLFKWGTRIKLGPPVRNYGIDPKMKIKH